MVATREATKTSGENKNAEAFQFESPVSEEIQHHQQERAHGQRLIKISDGASIANDALFHDGDEMEYRAEAKGAQGDAEQVFPPANQGEDGMQQAE
ncbi:MAG: hypothetical protein WDO73_35200 [Ignavibacteriota bacterium]